MKIITEHRPVLSTVVSAIGPDERLTQRKTLQTVWSKVNMVRIVPLNTLVVMRHV